MNSLYDNIKAAEDLARISCSRIAKDVESGHSNYLINNDLSACSITHIKQPVVWKLTDAAEEELHLRLPGVLCQKDLPPIVVHNQSAAGHRARRYLRQHVKLTGLGGSHFDDAVAKIQEIYVKFATRMDETTLEIWNPEFYDTFPAIQASTRYFTPVSMATGSNGVPFAMYVDPHGQLSQSMGSDFVHTAENRVDYYERIVDTNGKISYRCVDPISFKIGDIVEAILAFMVVPVNTHDLMHGRKKLVISLRGLVLLDSDQRNKSIILGMQTRFNDIRNLPHKSSSLKRRIHFADEENTPDEAAQCLKRMYISDDKADGRKITISVTKGMDVTP